ncbi:hypothetical protein [Bradyrhizobium erythrophlei]|uniref:Uncharacterized protein n=1 Tax=Bradyrhizobium erythrophlei TaxID=1437360 RepID=A0A1M5XX58_9BRAD|nr:hypothetical protein [Bradyrhizobium erythrophlei]SHI04312.1 hypothetical protein SAMN05443248_7694 [Bradyrhizobium erythrophlei]
MSKTKLTPEQSIERAQAALDRAKEKAARAKSKEREREQAKYWAERRELRNAVEDFQPIMERVDDELAKRFFPGSTAWEDEEGHDHNSGPQVAFDLADRYAKRDDDGSRYIGSSNALEEEAETAALIAAAKASLETFERVYRSKLEAGLQEWLGRPQAEVAAEIEAQQAENVERESTKRCTTLAHEAALSNARKLRAVS